MLGEDASPHVVGIICVAIVRGAKADDGGELRGAMGCDLECVETTPGQSDHPDTPRAPWLVGDPRKHSEAIVVLLLRVFVAKEAFRVATSAQVHAQYRVAMTRDVGLGDAVAPGRSVSLAVGNVIQDSGNGLALGVGGQPCARRQPDTIRHGNPDVGDLAHGLGRDDDPHRTSESD
jgi:hypothetical protein